MGVFILIVVLGFLFFASMGDPESSFGLFAVILIIGMVINWIFF